MSKLTFGYPVFSHETIQQRLDELAAIEWVKAPRVPQGMYRVCLTVDRAFDNIKQLRGADGELVELEIDPGYQPAHHAREWGTVAARPFASDEAFLAHAGYPCEVEAGDKVYVHYHAITEEYRYEVGGQSYYLVPYEMCYCAVRDGRIIPLSDYVLTAPLVVGEGEEVTPTGIILNPNVAQRLDTHFATVAFAPSPKPQIAGGIAPGRRVIFLSDADLPLTVEGVRYFIMHASDIIGFQDFQNE